MKLAILLAVMFFASAAQSQPLADGSSWYVLTGKHSEPWSLCYANVVAEKFKDGTYVEAEAAESAERDKDVQCKPIPYTPNFFEKMAQEECDKAQERARKIKGGEQAAGAELSDIWRACRNVPRPRYVGGAGKCLSAITELKRSQVLTVTKRLGPYPTAVQATDELRADGWRIGTNPSSGNPIWFKRGGCSKQDPDDRFR